MKPFFITGLPRSRTAWMANFFTTQTAWCWHDAMKDGWTAEYVRDRLASLPPEIRFAGDADSGLLMHAEELVDFFPAARWLFVRNTPERAAASYRKAFPPERPYPGVSPDTDVEAVMAKAQAYYNQARVLVPASRRLELELDDLAFPHVMRTVWDWLVPGLAWDERRYRMLDTLRVTVMPEKITMAPLPSQTTWARETFYAGK